MLTHRLQILLEEHQFRELEAAAQRSRLSIAAVIREAIDHRLHEDLARRREAIDRILSADPVPVPDDPADLKREIEAEHERKFRD